MWHLGSSVSPGSHVTAPAGCVKGVSKRPWLCVLTAGWPAPLAVKISQTSAEKNLQTSKGIFLVEKGRILLWKEQAAGISRSWRCFFFFFHPFPLVPSWLLDLLPGGAGSSLGDEVCSSPLPRVPWGEAAAHTLTLRRRKKFTKKEEKKKRKLSII